MSGNEVATKGPQNMEIIGWTEITIPITIKNILHSFSGNSSSLVVSSFSYIGGGDNFLTNFSINFAMSLLNEIIHFHLNLPFILYVGEHTSCNSSLPI